MWQFNVPTFEFYRYLQLQHMVVGKFGSAASVLHNAEIVLFNSKLYIIFIGLLADYFDKDYYPHQTVGDANLRKVL